MVNLIFPKPKPLPYVRDLNYFSPSSFSLAERDPQRFYLQKLGPKEFKQPYGPQNIGMAVGSAFDASVKTIIAERYGLECFGYEKFIAEQVEVPKTRWEDLPKNDQPKSEDHRNRLLGPSPWEHAVKLGHQLAQAYDRLGLIEAETWTGVEIHTPVGLVPGTEIPVFGQLDATHNPELGKPATSAVSICPANTVHDWKIAGGFMPSNPPSPNAGYVRLYDFRPSKLVSELKGKARESYQHFDTYTASGAKGTVPTLHLCGQVKSAHSKSALPMHEWGNWGAKWADQLTIYSWLERKIEALSELTDLPVSLDQVIPHPNGRVKVAQFRTTISVEYQLELIQRFKTLWHKIQTETLVEHAGSVEELVVSPRKGFW